MRHKGMIGAVVAGFGLLGLTMLQARPAGGPAAPARSVASLRASGVAAEGRVVTYPGGEVVVGAERAGRLVRVLVDENQTVRRGELVAELESDELRAALDEARARVGEVEAELRLAESNLKRRQELVAQQIAAAHELDQARRDTDTALARRETARATVSRLEAQLRKSRILAPIDGTVIARHADAGETIESGSRIATIADLSRLRIEAEADEADAAALAVGARASISADGYPGRSWNGRIEEVPDSVTLRRLKPQDPSRPTDTRVLAIKVAFAEPTPLRLGTTVDVRVLSLEVANR